MLKSAGEQRTAQDKFKIRRFLRQTYEMHDKEKS